MFNLDSFEEIKKLDTLDILQSIKFLPKQIAQAWYEVQNNEVPKKCYLAKNVVISGMGGSALGGRVADSLLIDRFRTPIEIVTDYQLPNYVNENTLVIVSSYSGNTAETISSAKEALNRGAVIYCIATGGELGELMRKNNLPGYLFNPKENPSNQPRAGLGYSIASILAVLAKCKFINILDSEVEEAIKTSEEFIRDFDVDVREDNNLAKKIARKLKGKIPNIVSSQHLIGICHAFKNLLNENAKTFAYLFDLPELNHHLMEGLRNPAVVRPFLHFLFIYSELYSKEVARRYPITYEVITQNDVSYDIYKPRSQKKLDQIFEILILGFFVSFYLAMLNDCDPGKIPWVNYFKKRLSKI